MGAKAPHQQLRMGEHIAHALVVSSEPTLGAMVFQNGDMRMAVTSNLATTRALGASNASAVRPLSGDSVLIADPDSHFVTS